MRRSYSQREWEFMLASLREKPRGDAETLDQVQGRLHAAVNYGNGVHFKRTQKPELFVVRNALASVGQRID